MHYEDILMLCEYGCGKKAKYQFKNGKWRCEKDFPKCLGIHKKNSEAHKGKIQSKETKKKISEATEGENNPMFGKTQSKETRKKQSEALKDPSKETRKKMSNSHKNPSKEIREKMRLAKKGKNLSKETRKKMRISAIKRIENLIGQISPNYNPEACKLIEEYGIENSYNFRHAENGGEFYIKGLGYWVDGYDKNKNIVIEIDESHHFDFDGNLCIKDIERQQEIEDFLNCKFVRLKI